MDFNFTYDIYPHPPSLSCNNTKRDTSNKKILSRNDLCPEHKIQLDCRSRLTRSCRYNDVKKDKFPSSCNFIDCNTESVYTPNVGYYKHYFSNIDIETELLHSKPAKCIECPKQNIPKCNSDKNYLDVVNDPCFKLEANKLWNNNSKRATLNSPGELDNVRTIINAKDNEQSTIKDYDGRLFSEFIK